MAMRFVHPHFLYSLLLLAIPIIIHLFNLRRVVTVYFSNVRLLQALSITTKSYSQLKQWLILLARLLALTFLVLAFAQPFIPPAAFTKTAANAPVSIYIDNSFSMSTVGPNGQLLETAKRTAADIVAGYPPNTKFQLLTNEFSGVQQRLLSKSDFLSRLEEIQPTSTYKKIQQIIDRQRAAIGSESQSGACYLVSNFKKNKFMLQGPLNIADSGLKYYCIPLHADAPNNVGIDSCWFNSPVHRKGQVEQLHFRLHNYGTKAVENLPLRCTINSRVRATATFNLKANALIDTMITYTAFQDGLQQGELEITDHPIQFDDKYFFSYSIAQTYTVLEIANPTEAFKANERRNAIFQLFHKDSSIRYTCVAADKMDYTQLFNTDLVILNEPLSITDGLAAEMHKFILQGGSAIFIPPANTESLTAFNQALSNFQIAGLTGPDTAETALATIADQSVFYAGVFSKKPTQMAFPKIKRYYHLSNRPDAPEETLLRLQNGWPFFSSYTFARGHLYLFAVPFTTQWSGFTENALFVPTLYQAVLQSRPFNLLGHTIGQTNEVEVPDKGAATARLRIHQEAGTYDGIPETLPADGKLTIVLPSAMKQAGHYLLLADKDTLLRISMNYNRQESDLSVLSNEELHALANKMMPIHCEVIDVPNGTISKVVNEMTTGTQLWKLCIIFVSVFLIAETLLQRYL